MDTANQGTLVEDKGLVVNANFGATRQVTVIEKEVFDRIRSELPDSAPRMRRANIMVGEIRLEDSRDQVLTLGDVKTRIRGETRPCELMDEQCSGLRDVLGVHGGGGGGAHGSVVQGGKLRLGDVATIDVAVSEG